jgi:hypothetical protein
VEILLNSFKNIASVNADMFEKIELLNNPALINEYDIRNILSATEIFDAEREANEIYRIYGKIEYLSLLNGLKNGYSQFQDFFSPQTIDCKTLLNSFDFYLVKAGTGFTHVISGSNSNLYKRYFQVVAKDIELFPAGFSNNVFGEQAYAFNINAPNNNDIDVSTYLDDFNFPATELFLYAQYKPTGSEKLFRTEWETNGDVNQIEFAPLTFNVGDYIQSLTAKISDLIEYSKLEFLQVQYSPQTFYIQTPYNTGRLLWKYNPLIPFRLRYFSSDLNMINTGTTVYSDGISIPYYATKLSDGTCIWRDILPQGYTDPSTNLGVDYPFVNKRRYLFSTVIFPVVPDLNNFETLNAFSQVWFSRYATTLNVKPMGDINNIGKPCQ